MFGSYELFSKLFKKYRRLNKDIQFASLKIRIYLPPFHNNLNNYLNSSGRTQPEKKKKKLTTTINSTRTNS